MYAEQDDEGGNALLEYLLEDAMHRRLPAVVVDCTACSEEDERLARMEEEKRREEKREEEEACWSYRGSS
jgi:hypothetical protein